MISILLFPFFHKTLVFNFNCFVNQSMKMQHHLLTYVVVWFVRPGLVIIGMVERGRCPLGVLRRVRREEAFADRWKEFVAFTGSELHRVYHLGLWRPKKLTCHHLRESFCGFFELILGALNQEMKNRKSESGRKTVTEVFCAFLTQVSKTNLRDRATHKYSCKSQILSKRLYIWKTI